MRLEFLGAAGTVTGSKTLVTADGVRLMLDCGLFQGFKALRERNWLRLAVEPEDLDAVVLTHAHIDHSGYLPRLVADGFEGPAYCTAPTADLLALLLPDSGHIQEEDARYANKRGFSRHRPAKPLYDEEQAFVSLQSLRTVEWATPVPVGPLRFELRRAGHILGAAMVRITGPDGTVLFSGDLGRPHDPIMFAPDEIEDVPDVLVLESTYGDRRHPDTDPLDTLAEIVTRTAARGGVLLIPAFAVGRAQAVLHGLYSLRRAGRIPGSLPIFVNSPMAVDATDLYLAHASQHRLSQEEARAMCGAARLVRSVEESKALNQRSGPAVIVSASGMLSGGRVLHHLRAFGSDPKNSLLFVGFQAAGTRGADILEGAEWVKVHGERVPIRCEVSRIDAWSAHADADEIMAWLSRWPAAPRHVVLNHGEPLASEALRHRIQDELGWSCSVAEIGGSISVGPDVEGRVAVEARPPGVAGRRRRRVVEVAREPRPLAVPPVEDTVVDAALASLAAEDALVLIGDVEEGWGPAIRRMVAAVRDQPRRPGALVVPVGELADEVAQPARLAGLPMVPVPASLLAAPHLPRRTRAIIAFPGGYGTLAIVSAALDRMLRGLGPRVPVILVDKDFWREVLDDEYLRQRGLVAEESADLVYRVDSVEQAWEVLSS